MTLWPISMFSMILAMPRATVPATHRLGAAGDHEPRRGGERALEGDRAADVARVGFAERLLDVAADRVEFARRVPRRPRR